MSKVQAKAPRHQIIIIFSLLNIIDAVKLLDGNKLTFYCIPVRLNICIDSLASYQIISNFDQHMIRNY